FSNTKNTNDRYSTSDNKHEHRPPGRMTRLSKNRNPDTDSHNRVNDCKPCNHQVRRTRCMCVLYKHHAHESTYDEGNDCHPSECIPAIVENSHQNCFGKNCNKTVEDSRA